MNATTKLLLLLSLVPACGTSPADEDAPVSATESGELTARPDAAQPVNVPGTYRHRMMVNGLTRETLVYVPESARGARPVPVVFMLHGTSGDGEKFYSISGWREKADEEGLIAVFPTALVHCYREDENGDGDFDDRGELKATTKWAAGMLGDPARMPLCTDADLAKLSPDKRAAADHPIADDIGFVTMMLDRMPLRYAVDTRRIYASGFSNGGQMTSRLALEMADRFAAIGANAGGLALEPHAAARPISVVFTVGEKDDRFTAASGVSPLPLDESLLSITLFRGIAGKFITLASLAETYDHTMQVISGKQVSTFVFSDSLIGATNHFELLVVEDLYHQYPNGTNHPMVMADYLWDFFKTESL